MIKEYFDKKFGVGLSPEERKYRDLSSVRNAQMRDRKIKSMMGSAMKTMSVGNIFKVAKKAAVRIKGTK